MKRSVTGARRQSVQRKSSAKPGQRQVRALQQRQLQLTARLRARERALEAWKTAHETLERRIRQLAKESKRARELIREQVARRKLVERAHRRVLGRLIDSQEVERRRIVRELHDEFGQELVALNLRLERMADELPPRSGARSLPKPPSRSPTFSILRLWRLSAGIAGF